MKIEHFENGHKGSFYITDNDTLLAEMRYSFAGADKMIIDQTQVSESLQGQGIGDKIINAAISYSRSHNMKIIPLCSFAKSFFDNHRGYKDVLLK